MDEARGAEAAREAATQLDEAQRRDEAARAERAAAIASGEPLDVGTAARQFVATLLAELGNHSYPGLTAVDPVERSRLARKKAIPCYFLADAKGKKTYVRGDPYEPLITMYVTLDGELVKRGDGPPARPWGAVDMAANLCRVAHQHGISLRAPYALRTHPNWPEAYR